MAIIDPALNVSDFVVDVTDGAGGGTGGGGIPQSRRIDTIFPLAGGGDLSADRSLSITMTPSGTLAVGSDRVVAGTSPILINGGPSSTLASDITISQNSFDGNNAGYVVPNPAGPTGSAYLDDTGNFSSSTVSGVPSNRTLTMVPPLTIDGGAVADLSANRTIDAGIFTSGQKGFVPASGGDPTKFLNADGTFKTTTSAGGGVTLQPSTPGTADVGNAHVTGTIIADTELVAGSTKRSLNGTGNEPLYVKQLTPSTQPVVGSYFAGSQTAGLIFRMGRGTEAAPVNPNTNDELASLSVSPWHTTGYDQREFLTITQRQSLGGAHTPFDVELYGRGTGTSDPASFLHLGGDSLSGIGTLTPASGFEVGISLGLKTKAIIASGAGPTYSYTVLDTDPPLYTVDATAYATTVNLPPLSNSRAGRVIGFTKVDETPFRTVTILPSGGASIGSANSYTLYTRGDSILIFSDGFNWWILASNVSSDQVTQGTDGTAVANTVSETHLTNLTTWNGTIAPGAVYRLKAAGPLSTTSNPTLRFKIKNVDDFIVADSGVLEMPDTVTNSSWQLNYTAYNRTVGVFNGRVVEATVKIQASDGVMTEYNMFSTFGNPSLGAMPSYITVEWGTADALNTIQCTASQTSVTPRTAVL